MLAVVALPVSVEAHKHLLGEDGPVGRKDGSLVAKLEYSARCRTIQLEPGCHKKMRIGERGGSGIYKYRPQSREEGIH